MQHLLDCDLSATSPMFRVASRGLVGIEANNLQHSWRFDWEPPKAVLRDVGIIVWTLGRLRSSAQADPIAGRPVLAF